MAKSKRSTAHLPKYEPQKWDYYSPGMSDPTTMSKADLVKVINRAAKAANQRLRSLEKAVDVNERTAGAYKYVQDQFRGVERPRFKERVKYDTDVTTLRQEYRQLREFISMNTSTPTGVRAIHDKRYQTAVANGFDGSREQWDMIVQKFFTKQVEKIYDSDTIYSAITGNNVDVMQQLLDFYNEERADVSRGQALVDYIRRIT